MSIFFVDFFYLYAQQITLNPIVINKDEMEAFNVIESRNSEYGYSKSVEEYLEFFSELDLRKRTGNGLQQDISLRGSTFQDNKVNINGIDVSDPQTGHYSLEIPFTRYDIETIKIEPNSQTVNFYIKEPLGKGIFLEHMWGEHAFFNTLLALNFPLLETKNRLSYEHRKSKGDRQDTDFYIRNLSFSSFWEKNNNKINFIFATTQREFGADSFYSASFPQEEEHINQKLFIIQTERVKENYSFKSHIFLRRHTDKFILKRDDPSFYTNYHTTYRYGYESKLSFKEVSFSFGIEKEKITSTNLGNHGRYKKDISVRLKHTINPLSFTINIVQSYYDNFGWLNATNITTTYTLKKNINLNFIFFRFWRSPSFTELYYESPVNKGNDKLQIQKSKNYEVSIDYEIFEKINLKTGIFFRSQSNTIDWIKENDFSIWEATNVGEVKAKGATALLNFKFKNNLIKKILLNYTYLILDKKILIMHQNMLLTM